MSSEEPEESRVSYVKYASCTRCGYYRKVRQPARGNTGLCASCIQVDPKVFAIDTARRMKLTGAKEERDLGK